MARSKLGLALAALGILSVLTWAAPAHADDLYLGSPAGPNISFTIDGNGESGSGGNFQNSTLNGYVLPWVYCTDVKHFISTSVDYPRTVVSHDGSQNGGTVNNAANIAYLLNNYAGSAVGDSSLQAALQAAIWKVEYGDRIVYSSIGDNSATTIATYTSLVSDGLAHTGNVGSIDWLSPKINPGDIYQGLVTAVPEPSTLAVAVFGGLGLLLLSRRRRSR